MPILPFPAPRKNRSRKAKPLSSGGAPGVVPLPKPYVTAPDKPIREWTAVDIERKVNSSPLGLDTEMLEVTRLLGDSAANGDKNDPVVFSGQTELALRRLAQRYGFERLPLTYGELNGFLDYVVFMHGASTDDIRKYPVQCAAWQRAALENCEECRPQWLEALKLYIADDRKALTAYHTRHDVMRTLGQEYREFHR